MSTANRRPRKSKPGQVRVSHLPLSQVRPSPENDELYRPVDEADPEFQALVQSVGGPDGVLEPLVVTADGWILSGHRRHAAARRAGLASIPCRVEPFYRADDPDRFLRLLREYNRQRIKSRDERVREAVLDVNPDEEHRALVAHRRRTAGPSLDAMDLGRSRRRDRISRAKQPMVDAVLRVLRDCRDTLPVSDRQIHYRLLNDPPLRHASKPASAYANNRQSYQDLCDLLTRLRLIGKVPLDAISDETRPVTVWESWREPGAYARDQLDGFLKGFYRDLMQSQPDHIEIVAEKLTLKGIVEPVAMDYTIPVTIGRGYCSLPPRAAIAKRFRRGGKRKLVLLVLSDHDPDGQVICQSFARSMRDDFDVEDVHAVKVALTFEQVARFSLPPVMKAKATSAHHGKFVGEFGEDVFELEALAPADLQGLLREAIDGVIDVDAFNAEVDAERDDAAHLAGVRAVVADALAGVDFGGRQE